MFCPLCRNRVGLLAKDCACGLNLATNDPAQAIKRSREDLKKARTLLLIGLAGTIATVLLVLLVQPKLSWVDWFTYKSAIGFRRIDRVRALVAVIPMLVPVAAVSGLGRGSWLLLRSRRRLGIASRMQQLPTARVV
jgi:hypothetical protein